MSERMKKYRFSGVRMLTPKDTFTVDYPKIKAFGDRQEAIFWPHAEIDIAKDRQSILIDMTESERFALIQTLKLFTKYEQVVGDEFWLNFVFQQFPRPADIQPMAAMFGAMELQVHANFYDAINRELGLSTDEFHNSYLDDKVLSSRIKNLHKMLSSDDQLRILGTFAFVESALLYTGFALIKHFQSQGKNKAISVVAGVNFTSRDEDLHGQAVGELFKTLKDELLADGQIDEQYLADLKADIEAVARSVIEHEEMIAAQYFTKGEISGIDLESLVNFAKSRVDITLGYLGMEPIYNVTENPVSKWFYSGIHQYRSGDHFVTVSNEYTRTWDKNKLRWKR